MHRKMIRQRHRKRVIRWSIITVLGLLLLTWFIFFEARAPMRKAHSEAFTIAQKSANIKNDQKFFMSDLGHTYYSILGTTSNHGQRYVIIDKNNGKATVVNAKSAINEQRATQIVNNTHNTSKIINVAPGINDNEPVWVVGYFNSNHRLCYDVLNFNNGKSIKEITNI